MDTVDKTQKKKKMSEDDRISDLNDEILHHILSSLPIKSQVSTSLLSRRWRCLWSHNPVLRLSRRSLDPDDNALRHTTRLIYHCLHQWQAPRLLDLHLFIFDVPCLRDAITNRWIDLAASRSLQHLTISYFKRGFISSFILPHSFYQCCPSLVSLALSNCSPPQHPPESPSLLRSLTTLIISRTTTLRTAAANIDALISACPLLESLKLDRCLGLHHLVVSSPTLNTLVVLDLYQLETLVVASTPRLRTVSFRLPQSTIVSFRQEVPCLLEFSFNIEPSSYTVPDYWLQMIPCISHVRILSIDLGMLHSLVADERFIRPDMFGDLKELHLNVLWLSNSMIDVVTVFFKQQPSIEKICLKIQKGYGLMRVFGTTRSPQWITLDMDGSRDFVRIMKESHLSSNSSDERRPEFMLRELFNSWENRNCSQNISGVLDRENRWVQLSE